MYRAAIVYDDRTKMAISGSHWRVASCSIFTPDRARIYSDQKITVRDGKLYMTVVRKLTPGHLCNPSKLLAEFWREIKNGEVIYFGKAA